MIDMLSTQTRQRMIEMESNESCIATIVPDTETITNAGIETVQNETEKVTYSAMLEAATELLSTVQNNQL